MSHNAEIASIIMKQFFLPKHQTLWGWPERRQILVAMVEVNFMKIQLNSRDSACAVWFYLSKHERSVKRKEDTEVGWAHIPTGCA